MMKWEEVKALWVGKGGDLNTLFNGLLTSILTAYVAYNTWTEARFVCILLLLSYMLCVVTKE